MTMQAQVQIMAVSGYVPDGRIDNYARAAAFGYEPKFIDEKIGAPSLSVRDPGQETSDLACQAVERLKASGVPLDTLDALIVCTQNPDGYGLPHTSAIVHHKLGLPRHCACFDISLGCSGYVYGLATLAGLMQSQQLRDAILVTADPYSKIIDPDDQGTAMIFGDGATATWLRLADEPVEGRLTVGRAVFGTDGSGGHHLATGNDRLLRMNGREVFNFCATIVPGQIRELLEKLELSTDDIDSFLLHQGSRYIVETIARRLKLPADRVPLGIAECGNTVSSSIPLMLSKLLDQDDKKRFVLSGFGVGLSFATMVLERQ